MSESNQKTQVASGSKKKASSPASISVLVAATRTPGSGVKDLELPDGTKLPVNSSSMASSSSSSQKKPSSKSTAKKSTSSVKTPKSSQKKSAKDDGSSPDGSSTKSTPSKSKNSKTYLIMAQEAILALGDRTGSSQIAIAKYILANNPHLQDGKPFRSRLTQALKAAVKAGKFQRVKNSFKLDSAYRKSAQKKKQQLDKKKEKEEKEASMSQDELKAQRALQRKKDEAAKAAKERADRIRKRRFPMEDTKLHLEDKELNVKPPADVTRRPALPCLFSSLSKSTSSGVLAASKCEHLEYGSRGLVPDLFAVYHFFCGDVHFSSEERPIVPNFSVKHLLYAVMEVVNGNAKKSKLVPPLISHLFVTCLQLLTSPEKEQTTDNAHEERLRQDLTKLAAGLSPSSWGEVCALYMDTMERYYTTDASVDPNVLPSGVIDIHYLMRTTDKAVPLTPAVVKKDDNAPSPASMLPDGYCAYLGNPHSVLARGHAKLSKQDPWNLTAEELMALLRALTNDILATRPEIGADIARRDGEMHELLRAKRAADTQFRKVRLAYEGPKQPSKAKPKREEEKPDADKPLGDSATEENKENSTDEAQDEPKFKPTATKKQFENATRAQQKAHDAYQKGLRTLISRTEPVGYDRHHNAVYFFNHDPERLYVEMSKPSTTQKSSVPSDMLMKRYSWHVIETKSLFDAFTSSLDIRGTRENDLYDSLLGPAGGHYSMKRGLYDDVKEESDKAARVREREDLERRLANAKIACQAEEEGGRRSGRLQSRAQIDLEQIEKEIQDLDKRIAGDAVPEEPDYEELTGLDLLLDSESVGGRETRRTRERKAASVVSQFRAMPCTKLLPSGKIDGTGTVGLAVSDLLKLEKRCDNLAPWERDDVARDKWISDLKECVFSWNAASQMILGSRVAELDKETASIGTPVSDTKRASIGSADSSGSKRRRLSSGSPASVSEPATASPTQILSMLKKPLLDLEQRVFEITGLATATQDADEADDNMSATSEDERSLKEQKEKLTWKKKVHSLRYIETKRYAHIREVLVEGINAARKAQLGSVVSKLRSALLLWRPTGASECRTAALAVLDSHGGYHEEEDDSDEDSDMEEQQDEEHEVPSLLSGQAMMVTGSLDGDEHADRVDWIDAVKNCKTMSRWSALAFAFIRKAETMIEKIEGESETLWELVKKWEKQEDRKARSRGGKSKTAKKSDNDDEDTQTAVWANVVVTREFCMGKVESFPAWPAKKCEAKDKDLAASLKSVGRALISLIGEDGELRVVKLEDIRPFDGKIVEEELSDQPKTIRTQLDECMVMARRIVRGRKQASKGDEKEFVEEKKTAM